MRCFMDKIDIPIWDIKYEVGVEDIDFQHRYFLKLINRFCDNVGASDCSDNIDCYIHELVLYAKFHFCSEENLMRSFKYPDLQRHIDLHRKVIVDLTNELALVEFHEHNNKNIIEFLTSWFLDHTVNEDSKFGNFYKNIYQG